MPYIPRPRPVAFIVGTKVVDVFRFVVNRKAGTIRAVSPYLDHVGADEWGEEGTGEEDRCQGEKTHFLRMIFVFFYGSVTLVRGMRDS